MHRLIAPFVRPAAVAAALSLLLAAAAPVSAEPAASGPVLPEAVAEHFRSLGVTVDPRQLAAQDEAGKAPMAAAAPSAAKPLRVGVFRHGGSATIATVPIDRKSYATAWQPGPSFGGSRVERLTAVHPDGRATAVFDGDRLKKIARDTGEFVALGRRGSHRTLTVDFDYGYKRDRRTVDLPEGVGETASIGGAVAEATEAATLPAKSAGKRKVRLTVKACKHWPKAAQLVDAWVDINPKHLPDGRAPASFPLRNRVGTQFATTIDTAKLATVRRDPAKVTAAVGSAAEAVCATIGKSKKRDLCSALGGEEAATIACRRILAPFTQSLCPAVREAAGWKPVTVDERPKAFEKPFEVRFNARFVSPYGYAWVSSTEPKKYGPNSDLLEGTLKLPCWDVYEAPVTMSGSYQWPTCFSPYAEAKATVQFANYMNGWYAWAGLSNWKLTVFQAPDCLSRNYVEGPFTFAGTAKLKGNYAHWTFSNAKWNGPDNFEAHINFSGDKVWGNVKDSRRGRRTSERATLYGEFSGRRAR